MRLLIVEDDAMIGAAAQQGLRHEGRQLFVPVELG